MAQNFIIPLKPPRPHQRIQIDLSGRTFFIDITWNGRTQGWMFDMYDSNLDPLIRNKFLSDRTNVLQDSYFDDRIPRGAIGFFSSIPGEIPTYENYGKSVKLFYREF